MQKWIMKSLTYPRFRFQRILGVALDERLHDSLLVRSCALEELLSDGRILQDSLQPLRVSIDSATQSCNRSSFRMPQAPA